MVQRQQNTLGGTRQEAYNNFKYIIDERLSWKNRYKKEEL